VRKISDYLGHAEECRRLAHTADTEEHKQTLLDMAQTWLELAEARKGQIARQRRVARIDVRSRRA
jgi:hypothetical protein